jgi:polygalacturonase
MKEKPVEEHGTGVMILRMRFAFVLLAVSCLALAPCPAAESPTDRSHAREREILARIKAPVFPDRDFAITDSRCETGVDAGDAIAKAIAACHQSGGGRVVIPAGTWTTGAIRLLSGVNLHVTEGATLKFDPNPRRYLPIVLTRFEGWNSTTTPR